MEPIPLTALSSNEATFEVHEDRRPGKNGVILVMIPHGLKIGDDEVNGWCLTWTEVSGLAELLTEASGLKPQRRT